jgi:sec-independent protein translocase protein TatC
MGDDPEPRGSRSDSEASADAESEAGADSAPGGDHDENGDAEREPQLDDDLSSDDDAADSEPDADDSETADDPETAPVDTDAEPDDAGEACDFEFGSAGVDSGSEDAVGSEDEGVDGFEFGAASADEREPDDTPEETPTDGDQEDDVPETLSELFDGDDGDDGDEDDGTGGDVGTADTEPTAAASSDTGTAAVESPEFDEGAEGGETDSRDDDTAEAPATDYNVSEGTHGYDQTRVGDGSESIQTASTPAATTADTVGDTAEAADTAGAVETSVTYEPSGVDDDDEFLDGPESDIEMPLADHIEEMVRRLGIVFLIAGVVAVAVFPVADDLVNFLWNTHIPGATTIESRRPRLYGPLELILTELKVAGLAGFVVGLPAFVYQTYRFMRPGLYPKERKYYLAAVPTSLILAFVGVAFAHFVVLPAIFAYFTSYTLGTAVIAFGLKETFGLILVLMGYMALVFQIPLFIMLAIMMGLVTRLWLEDKRLLFWGGFLGVSFLVSPDPTGMAPIIIAATMIVLFEGTLLTLRWVGR